MQYKKINCDTYNIHTIKTDKFRNCIIEIKFRKEIKKEEITKFNFLCDMLVMTNKTYPKRKEVVLKLEELYNTGFRATANRLGNAYTIDFITSFINPKYCAEKTLESIIQFTFDMLLNPNVTNEEFDGRSFSIEKNRLFTEINSLKENATRYALRHCMESAYPNMPVSFNMSGYLEDLEKITPSNLYKTYKQFLKEFICDVYVIGDIDMDYVSQLIQDNFKLHTIKDYEIDLYANPSLRKKVNVIKESGDYKQSSLIMTFNVNNLTKREKDAVIYLYDMLFGAGSLNCKLAKSLREENSLCYTVRSMYNKYDQIINVYAGIDKESYELSVKLIKKAVKDMIDGKFSEEDIENNKLQLISSVKASQDMPWAILNNYFFHNLDNALLFENRIEELKTVTKKEIMEVAKKIKLNTIYLLSDGGEE